MKRMNVLRTVLIVLTVVVVLSAVALWAIVAAVFVAMHW